MSSIDEYFLPVKRVCNLIGIWPNGDNASRVVKYFNEFRVLVSILFMMTILIPEMLAIIDSWGDLVAVTRVGCIFITISLLLFKITYRVFSDHCTRRIHFNVRELWCVAKTPEDLKILAQYARIGMLIASSLSLIGIGNIGIFVMAATIVTLKSSSNGSTISYDRLPYETRYWFDIDTPSTYAVICSLQLIAGVICTIGNIGIESYMLAMVLHACGHLALIRRWIQRFSVDIIDITTGTNTLTDEEKLALAHNLHRGARKCFQHHQKVTELAGDLKSLLSPLILAQFLTSASLICVSGYAVTTGMDSKADLLRFTCYLLSVTGLLAVWFTIGDMLIRESDAIGDAVFSDLNWYYLPLSLRRDFTLVIQRSQRNCTLTAAGISIANLEELKLILSSAVSYFTILRQMKGE